MPTIPTALRGRVTRAEKGLVEAWREGVSLEQRTGQTIDNLRHLVTVDRLTLARATKLRADHMMDMQPPHYRDAISRYYYAMYHAARATTYFHHGGDDFEGHSTLPAHLPGDFPNRVTWSNLLKDARERRNEADYEPYPKSNGAWRSVAIALQGNAVTFMSEARLYLKAKGCVGI